MAFDLTSTQETAHNFFHQKLTTCSISVDLTFSRALADNVKILLLGERNSMFYITSDRKVTKNALITLPGHG